MHTHTDQLARLRLFQLISPSLPIGAFAYSQGIEWAAENGWIRTGAELEAWLGGLLSDAIARVDLPVLIRQYTAWQRRDPQTVETWNHWLLACRESAELREEERNRGRALATLLPALGVQPPDDDWKPLKATQSAGFSLAACHWRISLHDSCAGYAWGWLENQVLSAVKAIPLGQTVGQQVLLTLGRQVPAAIETALSLPDDELGASAPAVAIASSRHETQYTRIFRS